jgi:hypothetical protein
MSRGRHRPRRGWFGPVLVALMVLAFTYLAATTLSEATHTIHDVVPVPACRDTATDLYRDGSTWWTCAP